MKIVGIAGGSGSGKSTVGYQLVDTRPDLFEVINLDDYQKYKTDANLPIRAGMINWDHPDIIRYEDLINDLETLKSGQPIEIMVWAHRSNPNYTKTSKMIPRTIYPKPIIIVEGYLALYDPALRKLYDKTYYFDLDEKTRKSRREKNAIIKQDEYYEKVLKPMHAQYVVPAKKHANRVINVANLNVEELNNKLLSELTD